MSFDLLVLGASLLTWGFGEGMFIYFQPIYLQQLGANTMTIAMVFSAFGLAMMVTHIPAGYLADRIGRKPLLVASWSIGLLAAGIMAMARSLPVFVAGLLVYGLTAFVSSPMNSYVSAARGKLSVVRVMTLVSAAYNLGAVLGPISGGWIAGHFGLRTVYLVATCIFVVSTGLMLFIHPQPLESHDPSSPPEQLWRNTRFVSFLGIIFMVMFVMYLPQPLTPKFLQNERGLSLESIGLLGSIGSLGNTILALVLGQFSARTGFLLAQLLVAVFSLLLWKGTGLPWYALGYFLLGGFRTVRSTIFAQVHMLIHSAQMGLAYGVSETFSSLAVMLSPLLAGVLYTWQPGMVYWVSACLAVVMVLVSWSLVPHTKNGSPPILIRPLDT
jgi:MFS family permease